MLNFIKNFKTDRRNKIREEKLIEIFYSTSTDTRKQCEVWLVASDKDVLVLCKGVERRMDV